MARVVALAGLAWPFEVALLGVALAAAHEGLSDSQAVCLLAVSFLGWPPMAWAVYQDVPGEWPRWARLLLTAAVAGSAALLTVCMAAFGFVVGYTVVGWNPA